MRYGRGSSRGGAPGKSNKSNNDNEDYDGLVGRVLMTKMPKDCARIINTVLVNVALENGPRSPSMTDVDNNEDRSRGGVSNSLSLLPPPLAMPRVLHPRPLVVLSATGSPCVAHLTSSATSSSHVVP